MTTIEAKEIYPGVTVNPRVMGGTPVLTGTRIPIGVIVGHLAAGDPMQTVMDEYRVTHEQILAALCYAAPHYSMVIEWSDEDQKYIVSFPEWGSQTHTHGATYEDAVVNGRQVLDDLIDLWQEQGRALPQPRVFAGSSSSHA